MATRFPALAGAIILALSFGTAALAAEPSYPFEGTWIRADHSCTPTTARARTYTAKEVVSPLGRCSIRRVASSGNYFELLEECRRNDRQQTVTEILRLTSPDAMVLRRQLSRLKIPRQVHYARCNLAAPSHRPPSTPYVKPGFPEPKPR